MAPKKRLHTKLYQVTLLPFSRWHEAGDGESYDLLEHPERRIL